MMTIRPGRAAAASAVVFTALLSGCGNHPAGTPAPAASTAAPSVAHSEGPATGARTWPDGFTTRIVAAKRVDMAGLKRMDPNMDPPPAGTTLVTLTVALSNTGSTPVALPPHQFLWHVLTGPNRLEAHDYEGDQFTGPTLTSDVPEQVTPGQTVTLFDSWSIPTADLSTVAVRVDVGGTRAAYTFAGVRVTSP